MGDRFKTTRRQLILGKFAAAHDHAESAVIPESIAKNEFLSTFSSRAMACQFEVYLDPHRYSSGPETALTALQLIGEIENVLTVYRLGSMVSQLNQRAAKESVSVDDGLFQLLEHSLQIFESTGGAFDVTAGPLSRVWGFHDRQPRIPDEQSIESALALVGSQHIQLDRERRTIKFLLPDTTINLGSIGKGYALDQCAEIMEQQGIDDFLIHGGQSSVLARGNALANDESAAGWLIGLAHPISTQHRLGTVRLLNRSLGTSGSQRQSLVHNGQRLGHIIDPRTGWPATGVLSATVLAPTAADADALATAFYVLGVAEVSRFCAARSDITAIMVIDGKKPGTIDLATFNLDEDDLEISG